MATLKSIAKDVIAGKLILSSGELATERMKVCAECDAYQKLTMQCKLCHCFLPLKAKILDSSCPIDKW